MGVAIREKVKDSGEWWCFVRHQGKRWSVKCGSEQDAKDTAGDVRKEIRQGKFDIAAITAARIAVEKPKEGEKPALPTLREFHDNTVLSLWEGSLSRATYESYAGSFRVHILPELGDVALAEISRDRLKSFVAKLRKKTIAARQKRQADEGKEGKTEQVSRLLSKETIRNIVAALRSALSEAVESNLIASNPAVKLGKFYKEAQDFHEEIDPFSADEVSLLLKTTRERFGFSDYVLLLTLFHCGPRAGEAAGLQWPDLDAKNRVLLVRRQFTRGKKGKTKTRKKRPVDVSSTLLAELIALKKQRQAAYLERGKGSEIPEYMFLGPGNIVWEDGKPVGREEGKPLDMNNWRNRVYWKACDAAGIRRRRLHDTRHTFASLLLGNGESLKYVSTQLGHASIRMTADVYGHLEVGANRAAMDRLPTLQSANTAKSASA